MISFWGIDGRISIWLYEQGLKHLQVGIILIFIKHYGMETAICSYFIIWERAYYAVLNFENTGISCSVGTHHKHKWTQKILNNF